MFLKGWGIFGSALLAFALYSLILASKYQQIIDNSDQYL